MPQRIRRRTFLAWSAGALALPALAGCDPDDQVSAPPFVDRPEDPARFPLGLHAGAMTADGARLWTHCAEPAPLILRLWPAAAPADAPPALELDLAPTPFLAPRISGLPGGERWRYAFFDDRAGARSAYGAFCTAFGPDQGGRLRLGATACTNDSRRPFPALDQLAAAELHAFCHLGDFNYNDDRFDLEGYRAGFARNLAAPEYRALLGGTGSYFAWDDHEFFDNAQLHAPDVDLSRIRAAKQAYYEHFAVDARDQPGAGALGGDRVHWGSYRWGRTAEIFVLDSRLERQPATRGAEDIYLGRLQLDWLKGALAASPAHFKILLNSVPIAALPPLWGVEDRWTEYPTQRAELLDHLHAAEIRNVVFLAGDFHVGAVWRVEPEGPASACWEILCGPGGSAPSRRLELAGRSPNVHAAFFPPGRIEHAHGDHAATIIELDPDADTLRVRHTRAADGAILYDQALRCAPS